MIEYVCGQLCLIILMSYLALMKMTMLLMTPLNQNRAILSYQNTMEEKLNSMEKISAKEVTWKGWYLKTSLKKTGDTDEDNKTKSQEQQKDYYC